MASSRPRLLWVTEEVPDRNGGGGAIRQANLVIQLAEHLDVDLLVAGTVTDPLVRAAAREVVEVPVLGRPPSPAQVRRALLLHGQPIEVTTAGPARAALRPELRQRAPHHDLVVLNHDTLAPLLGDVRGAVRVAHAFHVGSARAGQAAALAARWRERALLHAMRRAHRRVERGVVGAADVLLTCADADAARILAGHPAPPSLTLVTAPNGVDLDRFRPTPLPGGRRVLFLGSLDYPPNVDGIVWFVDEVWPQVRAAVADVALDVVGRSPAAAVRRLATRPDVHVAADVPASVPWYEAADVVVVPLRIGTGTRLKALEAMAAGRPVVGTSIGLEGLGLEGLGVEGLGVDGGATALIADDASGLAAAVVRCLLDRDLAARMAAAGRAHVETQYGWPMIGAALAAALTAVTGAARGAP